MECRRHYTPGAAADAIGCSCCSSGGVGLSGGWPCWEEKPTGPGHFSLCPLFRQTQASPLAKKITPERKGKKRCQDPFSLTDDGRLDNHFHHGKTASDCSGRIRLSRSQSRERSFAHFPEGRRLRCVCADPGRSVAARAGDA